MIEEKQKLSGNLNIKQSLNGSLNNAVIYIEPITQEKEVTPSKEVQEVIPDSGFTGLSKVIVNPYTPVVASKTITENGTYKAADDNLDGYDEVKVATSGVNLNDYIDNVLQSGSTSVNGSGIAASILKIPDNMTFKSTSAGYSFWGCTNLEEIPLLDTSKITYMREMFSHCTKLTSIPLLDTSNVKSMEGMFSNCTSLVTIPLLNTSKVTEINSMFNYCTSLITVPLLDISKARQMQHTFSNCISLTSIPQLNTGNVTSFYNCFYNCKNLTDIPLLDASKATYMVQVFSSTPKLANFGGFKDLGKAYLTTQSTGYGSYRLDLRWSPSLTHDSLMNVINNLYDIKSKGCNAQELVLTSKNLTKLTAEEIAIATNKGWTVS